MNDREKLGHLLEHWVEHNSEHARTYVEWAEKAEAFGDQELSSILKDIADRTVKLGYLFKKAQARL